MKKRHTACLLSGRFYYYYSFPDREVFSIPTSGQFHQHFTSSFYTFRSQKRKKDSQLKQLFALLGSARIKAAHKHFDEIDPSIRNICRVIIDYCVFYYYCCCCCCCLKSLKYKRWPSSEREMGTRSNWSRSRNLSCLKTFLVVREKVEGPLWLPLICFDL